MSFWDALMGLIFGRRGPTDAKPKPEATAPKPPPPVAPPAPPPPVAPPAPPPPVAPPAPPPPVAPPAPPPPVVPPPPPVAPPPPAPPPVAPPPSSSEPPLTRWRLARSLEKLRAQANAKFPARNKGSDGTIGDAAHASRDSDHNPHIIDGDMRVVSALDLTNDHEHCPSQAVVDALVASRDPRIKYIIFNEKMVSSYPTSSAPAWTWRPYGGANKHQKHFHISVVIEKAGYDDERDWAL